MKILILDLIMYNKSRSLYNKLIQPYFASHMPKLIKFWLSSHDVKLMVLTSTPRIKDLPDEVSLVFIQTYTMNYYLAQAISKYYRSKNIITVIGGPHTLSYPTNPVFTVTLLKTSRSSLFYLMRSLRNIQHNQEIVLTTNSSLESVVLESESKFILGKLVTYITSQGCDNRCSFCRELSYTDLSHDLYQDLVTLLSLTKPVVLFFHDANLSNNLNKLLDSLTRAYEYVESLGKGVNELNIILELEVEKITSTTSNSMKLLGLKSVSSGVETFHRGLKRGRRELTGKFQYISPKNKMISTSKNINKIVKNIPNLQLNMLFGLDNDCRELENKDNIFDLTKEFIRRTPKAYINFQTLTSFGNNTRLSQQLISQGRIINVPYNLLDGYRLSNIVLDCDPILFYSKYAELIKYASSLRVGLKRVALVNDKYTRLYYLLKLRSERNSYNHFINIVNKLKTDTSFYNFLTGKSKTVPRWLKAEVEPSLGEFSLFA